jgi:hypothetical protein
VLPSTHTKSNLYLADSLATTFQFAIKVKIYITMILRVLFYMGAKLGLSQCGREVGLVFENRVLRRICGPKRDEVTGEWRRPDNEEL